MCMQFTLDKIPSKIFVFTTAYFFLLFNVEKLQIHGVTLVWRSRPFTIRCAGERVWNHAIHRHSSIPATLEYHYDNRRPREYHYQTRRPILASRPAVAVMIFTRSRNAATVASYPGPFTCAVRAGREIRAWYQSFAHAYNFTGILVK